MYRIVLYTKFRAPETLGLFSKRDTMEFLRLWWQGNDIENSHWMSDVFESIVIEPDDAEQEISEMDRENAMFVLRTARRVHETLLDGTEIKEADPWDEDAGRMNP